MQRWHATRKQAVLQYIQAGVGSYLNSPTAGGTIDKLVACDVQQWRAFTQELQQAYKDAGKVRTASHIIMVRLCWCSQQAVPAVTALDCAY